MIVNKGKEKLKRFNCKNCKRRVRSKGAMSEQSFGGRDKALRTQRSLEIIPCFEILMKDFRMTIVG